MSITCSSLLWWWSWMRFTGNDPTDEGWTDDWWSPSTAKLLPSGWTWTQVAVVTILNWLRGFFFSQNYASRVNYWTLLIRIVLCRRSIRCALQEFAKIYLANPVFCQLLKSYAK
jgi:hypothetical protein